MSLQWPKSHQRVRLQEIGEAASNCYCAQVKRKFAESASFEWVLCQDEATGRLEKTYFWNGQLCTLAHGMAGWKVLARGRILTDEYWIACWI